MSLNTVKAIEGMPLRWPAEASPVKAPPRPDQPKFGFMGAEAFSMLVTDTTSVLIPKLLVTRTKINAFEDIFLECAENVPFYIVVPLVAKQLFAKAFGKLNLSQPELSALATPAKNATAAELERSVLGTSMKNLLARADKAGIAIPTRVVGAKAATILGSLALAGGVEYLVQFAKNVISAEKYQARDFSAVAGLKSYAAPRGGDPVEKAKKRTLQTGLATLGFLGAAFALPTLIARSNGARKIAQALLKQFDFSHGTAFDMSKPLLFVLALIGFGSYLDASRDKLEFKENLTRVPIIIGFYMAGKEVLSNLLAAVLQRRKIEVNGETKRIREIAPFLDRKLLFKDSFLDFNIVKSAARLGEELAEVKGLPLSARDAIVRQHNGIVTGARLFTILIMGVLFNKMLYQATEARNNNLKPQGHPPQLSFRPAARFEYLQQRT